MTVTALPAQDVLRQLLDYHPETGVLTWRHRPLESFTAQGIRSAEWGYKHWASRFSGKPALTASHGKGYRRGRIGNKAFMAHRIIWKWMTGGDPDQIDHINGNRADNRFSNLRTVTGQQNVKNKSRYTRSTTGISGIAKSRSGLWVSRISSNSKELHLGTFHCLGQAISARKAAEIEHGFSANHGRAA